MRSTRACVRTRKPLVAGAAIRFDGQISVYDTRDADVARATPACSRPTRAFEETRCATMGVFAPLVGIIGSMQAAEALKLLAGIGRSLAGRLQMLDARHDGVDRDAPASPATPGCGGVRRAAAGSAAG